MELVRFTLRPLYHPYPFCRRLGGPRSRFVRFGVKKSLVSAVNRTSAFQSAVCRYARLGYPVSHYYYCCCSRESSVGIAIWQWAGRESKPELRTQARRLDNVTRPKCTSKSTGRRCVIPVLHETFHTVTDFSRPKLLVSYEIGNTS
jgi:hypothetical protein